MRVAAGPSHLRMRWSIVTPDKTVKRCEKQLPWEKDDQEEKAPVQKKVTEFPGCWGQDLGRASAAWQASVNVRC
jgi:hypothetical protein